jgi:hypothetical protein
MSKATFHNDDITLPSVRERERERVGRTNSSKVVYLPEK